MERLHQVEKQLVTMYIDFGPPPMAPAVKDSGREAEKTFIAIRGNWQAPGDEVSPGFLTALGGGEPAEPPLHATTTYRRKALAEWIANPENPLFARVMVNRVWQFHFGVGTGANAERFRSSGRTAVESGAARLARPGISRRANGR